ncbi:MAG TPA: hypothetical protein VI111_02165 [Thermoleophilaceae bacterium]
MTAEIAVLNKEAVALSADSAVTIQTGVGPKVFNSVSKIFGLTRSEPVGIMLYGQANFLDVPWETIIKAFREEREPKPLDDLPAYGAAFIQFIEDWPDMFPDNVQQDYVAHTINSYFGNIERSIVQSIEEHIEAEGRIKRSHAKAFVTEEIEAHHSLWKAAPDTDGGLAGTAKEIRTKYATQIKEARLDVFANAQLNSSSAKRLGEIASWLFTKKPPEGTRNPHHSGIVVAGFGSKDYFPCLVNYEVEGMALNAVKYTLRVPIAVSRDEGEAFVVPFAQRDSVVAFMEGLHPIARRTVLQEMVRLLSDYPREVLEEASISPQTRQKVLEAFRKRRQQELDVIIHKLLDHVEQQHVSPVVEVVSVLPKDELAMMAESLVSLTSFRHRVSFGAETVGGPIDVAVISKGDGFVWIKRKHYFKQELNPQFVAHRHGGSA